jgi:hypothetical protein
MPYTLSKTNGSTLTILNDGTVDNTTDLVFIGKNYTGYGDPVNENFIRLLENFANITPPNRPLSGQIWFDATTNRLKVFTGSRYRNLAVISTGTSFPLDSTTGDMHFNGSLFYAYTGASWLPVGPLTSTSGGGAELPATSVITESQSLRNIISLGLDNESVAVFSTSTAYAVFSTDPFYNKYPGIYPGINLPDTDEDGISAYYDSGSNIGNLLWGTAGSALGLVDYSSASPILIRSSDIVLRNSPLGAITINDDAGVLINDVFQLHVTREQGIATSSISNVRNNVIKFNINTVNGTYTNFINFDARSGFYRVLPTTATDVSLGSSNTGERFANLHVNNIFSNQAAITTVTSTRLVGSIVSATQLTVSSNATVTGSLQIGTTSTINGARIWTTSTLVNNSQLVNDAGYLTANTVGSFVVSSVNGTANQVTVTPTTGSVVVSLPNNLQVGNVTANRVDSPAIYMNGSLVLTAATVPSGGIVSVVGTATQIVANQVGSEVRLSLPSEVIVTRLRGGELYDNNARVLTGNSAVTRFSTGGTGFTPFGSNTGEITLGGILNVSNGGTGASSLTGYLKGNGTGAFTAVAKVPYADISGSIPYADLTGKPTNVSAFSNDSGYITRSFPTGTRMLFVQTSAPTGWTQVNDLNLNNRALRVVAGSGGGLGGTMDFTSAFASRQVSGTVATNTTGITLNTINPEMIENEQNQFEVVRYSLTDPGHSHSFTGGFVDFAVKYVDVIVASKD